MPLLGNYGPTVLARASLVSRLTSPFGYRLILSTPTSSLTVTASLVAYYLSYRIAETPFVRRRIVPLLPIQSKWRWPYDQKFLASSYKAIHEPSRAHGIGTAEYGSNLVTQLRYCLPASTIRRNRILGQCMSVAAIKSESMPGVE